MALCSCTYAPHNTRVNAPTTNHYDAPAPQYTGVDDRRFMESDIMPKDYSRYTNKQLADEIIRQELLKSLR
jgi:hypothetical protein